MSKKYTGTYKDYTIELAGKRAEDLPMKFLEEVGRLLKSGAIDPEDHSRGLLFGVALENLADGYLHGERQSKAYKNLKRF